MSKALGIGAHLCAELARPAELGRKDLVCSECHYKDPHTHQEDSRQMWTENRFPVGSLYITHIIII